MLDNVWEVFVSGLMILILAGIGWGGWFVISKMRASAKEQEAYLESTHDSSPEVSTGSNGVATMSETDKKIVADAVFSEYQNGFKDVNADFLDNLNREWLNKEYDKLWDKCRTMISARVPNASDWDKKSILNYVKDDVRNLVN